MLKKGFFRLNYIFEAKQFKISILEKIQFNKSRCEELMV